LDPFCKKSGWTIISGDGFPGDDQSSNNSSGFNMLPVGYYTSLDGEWVFEGLGLRANLWTLTENDNSSAYNTRLYFNRDDFSIWAGSKNDGFSVRFLRE